jgi:DeoR family transcriptional regulator of aga operon
MAKGRAALNTSEENAHSNQDTVNPTMDRAMDGMMAEERRTEILQIVRREGRARVTDLANRFNMSPVTVRSDLNQLHQRGLVLRSHGGAVLPDTVQRESPIHERLKAHSEEKRRIGAMAATLINDGETIILDSGTTTLEIARQIKNKRGLQIITNGVNIAAELLDARGVQTFIVGGTVRGDSASIIGRSTEDMLEQFRADKLFLGGAGCDPEFGVSGTNLEETMVNRAMLRISREIILVADASKFSIRSMSRIAPFSGIDSIAHLGLDRATIGATVRTCKISGTAIAYIIRVPDSSASKWDEQVLRIGETLTLATCIECRLGFGNMVARIALPCDGMTLLLSGGMKGEVTAGEIDRPSGSHGLVGGEHDRQARETVLQVRGQVELLANGPHEKLLFAPAELLVTGLASLRQPFVGAGKAVGRRLPPWPTRRSSRSECPGSIPRREARSRL